MIAELDRKGSVLVWISLCNLCVLGVSVVNEFFEENHHRDTEDTEVAQRRTQISEREKGGGVPGASLCYRTEESF